MIIVMNYNVDVRTYETKDLRDLVCIFFNVYYYFLCLFFIFLLTWYF